MRLSIEIIARDFFPSVPAYNPSSIKVAGWTVSPSETASFVEPPLVASSDGDFQNSKIWLISAPGAVGKSTFAKQLARKTGAIFVDLAKTDTIGTNYLTGSLFKANLTAHMAEHKVALLMDALDEASLRVTFESRIHFFDDVIAIARDNAFPVLIFGRPAAIDESQLILEDKGFIPAIISIDYFTREDAIQLVQNMALEKLRSRNDDLLENFSKHQAVLQKRISDALEILDTTANNSGKNFSRYAPVLDAVAEFFCRYSNFSQAELSVQDIFNKSILERICRYILEREQNKLIQQLPFNQCEKDNLYNAQEQMRALCHIYAGHQIKEFSFDGSNLPDQKKQAYVQIAQEFIEQHPFLVDGRNPTNEVFSGAMQSFALKKGASNGMEVFLHHAVSPLLAEFYFKDDELYCPNIVQQKKKESDVPLVEIEHIPFLLSSYEALASSQDKKVFLDITEAKEINYADISITCYDNREEKEEELQHFRSKADGKLIFEQHVGGLTVSCRMMEIEFRNNSTFCLTLPLDIDVRKLSFCCPELQFVGGGVVTMTANEAYSQVSKINKFGTINIYVNWPGAREYPWSIATPIERDGDEENLDDLQTALLSFCKLIRSFRSHSKGQLARFEDKIDHSRMSKNFGEEIKNYLMEKRIIQHSVQKRMYYLDSDRLVEETGAHYGGVIQRDCPEKLRNILKSIIEQEN